MKSNPIIEAFFEKWEIETFEWYKAMKAERQEIGGRAFTEKYKYELSKTTFNMIAGHTIGPRKGVTTIWDVVHKDMQVKKETLYAKIADRAGEIEATHLHAGEDGSPNGYVKGDKAIVNITTIAAGGMVQCNHYRVLVKERKNKK